MSHSRLGGGCRQRKAAAIRCELALRGDEGPRGALATDYVRELKIENKNKDKQISRNKVKSSY